VVAFCFSNVLTAIGQGGAAFRGVAFGQHDNVSQMPVSTGPNRKNLVMSCELSFQIVFVLQSTNTKTSSPPCRMLLFIQVVRIILLTTF
jgi:hypothetical protein